MNDTVTIVQGALRTYSVACWDEKDNPIAWLTINALSEESAYAIAKERCQGLSEDPRMEAEDITEASLRESLAVIIERHRSLKEEYDRVHDIMDTQFPRIRELESERDKYRAEVHRQVSAKLVDTNDADLYQHNAARTFPEMSQQDALDMTALGLVGEAGEIADAWKKVRWHGHAHDIDDEIKELGDLQWYIAIRAHTLGVSLSTIMARNIAKLKARYPDGFDAERSQHRDHDGRGRAKA